MIGKFPFFLSAATAVFLGLSAGAVTTSQNVDIIVTHGAPLTTFTFVNNTGNTLPAGSPVSFGQAFRYGDIMPGTYPLIRDAATHVALPGQQWDEISTWRENGGNGSWRHAVWAAWLPNSLAAGATYQVEFVAAAGTYSQSSHQALSALCSGPAAHDLKIHLTDVRNQNDTVRDSGDATFRVCDNINNVGRDAPRHLRSGNVYDEYLVSGMFVYTGAGHKDPLLYAQAIVDIFTKTDGVSAGDVRWVFHIHNSWENVAAGSTGNAGNPGPAGFANDPQTISYRAEIDDGASNVLDWSGLDATVTSASNPIIASAGTCDTTVGSFCMSVPSSTGANQGYYGQAVRVSTTGTPVAGLTAGNLYYVFPATSSVSSNTVTTGWALMLSPYDAASGIFPMTGSQGTGTTTFSTRIPHTHWSTWQTLDATGQDNWAPFGTTSRVTRKVYPAFTAAEKRYWEETGLIIPLNLSQSVSVTPSWRQGLGPNYEPFGAGNVIGFQGAGTRPDLGVSGEWASQAFITGTQHDWDNARLFTLGTSTHGYGTLLNEATGRLPALNNGPPTGPGGNGVGGSYAGLGAPQPSVSLDSGGSCLTSFSITGLADTPHNTYNIDLNQWRCGTYISHMPSFNGFTYAVFGDRHFLDMMRWHGNQDYLQQRVGPGPALGQGYYRDNNASFNGTTYHYYGLLTDCCQTRGSAHLFRDIIYPATFGSDGDIERSYFHDFLKETANYYPLWLKFKDNAGLSANTNYSTSIMTPDAPGYSTVSDTFIMSYVAAEAGWMMTTFLHEPLGSSWMSKYQRFYEGVMGGQLPGAPVSFYAVDFNMEPFIHNGDDGSLTSQNEAAGTGNFGPSVNGTDASDFGSSASYTYIFSGGQIGGDNRYTYTAGDFLKPITAFPFFGAPKFDQLDGSVWYKILGPVNNNVSPATFYLQCPVGHAVDATCPTPGAAFTGFSRGGVTVTNERDYMFKFRLTFDPGPGNGYVDSGYDQYAGQTLSALKILGYSVPHALADFAARDGGNTVGAASPSGGYNSSLPSNWWDQTVIIPGLPTPHNGL
jgi:hypothetical protein